MGVKKRSVQCISLDKETVFILQRIGFMNKKKELIKRGFSRFVNNCIHDKFGSVNPMGKLDIEKDILIKDINSLQSDISRMYDEIKLKAIRVTEINNAR